MAMHPNSLANLKPPFGPDNPPPKSPGAPRKRPLTEAYDDWLREPVSPAHLLKLREEGIRVRPGMTNADMVALAQGNQAIRGNTAAAKEMGDRVEGKAMQRIELTGLPENRQPEFVVVYATAVPGAELSPEKLLEAIKKKNTDVIDVTPEPEKTDGEEK
jgi:hypothetical protein